MSLSKISASGLSATANITASQILSVSNTAIIGTTLPGAGQVTNVMLDTVSATGNGAMLVPVGNTSQRPANPQAGQLRYNSTTGYFEIYSSLGWNSIAIPPLLTNVTPSQGVYVANNSQTFYVNGSYFDSNSTIQVISSNNAITYTPNTQTFINSSNIAVSFIGSGILTGAGGEPYSVKITSSGLSTTLTNAFNINDVPTWATPSGNLGTVYETVSNTITLLASDPEGSGVSYSQTAGTLPYGMTLNVSSGIISGTASSSNTYNSNGTTFNFDVGVTDGVNSPVVRSFNILRKWLDGSSSTAAAPSASYIKTLTGTNTDGKYWLKPTGGTGTAFESYCIMSRDGGGWVKVIQFNGGTSMATTSAVNAGGTWCNAEVNLYAGKISTTDWVALNTTNSFLFRVNGGSDNLLYNGAGTGKLSYSGTLPAYGTDLDPTANYTLSLDTNSDGTYEYNCNYTNDTRGRCSHVTNYWISDHNYNASFSGTPPPLNSVAICWTVGSDVVYTNLHWMSGFSTGSAGSVAWGNTSGSAFSIFVK